MQRLDPVRACVCAKGSVAQGSRSRRTGRAVRGWGWATSPCCWRTSASRLAQM